MENTLGADGVTTLSNEAILVGSWLVYVSEFVSLIKFILPWYIRNWHTLRRLIERQTTTTSTSCTHPAKESEHVFVIYVYIIWYFLRHIYFNGKNHEIFLLWKECAQIWYVPVTWSGESYALTSRNDAIFGCRHVVRYEIIGCSSTRTVCEALLNFVLSLL